MTIWRLKGCPRCGGDIFIEARLEGWYEQCLQCAYQQELKEMNERAEAALSGSSHRRNRKT